MLRIIFNWRYWVLLAIGCIALIGIFGSPEEYEGFAWCGFRHIKGYRVLLWVSILSHVHVLE